MKNFLFIIPILLFSCAPNELETLEPINGDEVWAQVTLLATNGATPAEVDAFIDATAAEHGIDKVADTNMLTLNLGSNARGKCTQLWTYHYESGSSLRKYDCGEFLGWIYEQPGEDPTYIFYYKDTGKYETWE